MKAVIGSTVQSSDSFITAFENCIKKTCDDPSETPELSKCSAREINRRKNHRLEFQARVADLFFQTPDSLVVEGCAGDAVPGSSAGHLGGITRGRYDRIAQHRADDRTAQGATHRNTGPQPQPSKLASRGRARAGLVVADPV